MSTNPNPQIKPGTILVHRTGGVAMVRNRKVDDPGWWNTDGSGFSDAALTVGLADGTWTAYTPQELVAALRIGQDSVPVAPESDANPTSAPAVPRNPKIELQGLAAGPRLVRIDHACSVNPEHVVSVHRHLAGCRINLTNGPAMVLPDTTPDEVFELLTGGDQ